jgi:hypothetical protein
MTALAPNVLGDLSPNAGDECRLIDGRVGADGLLRADISTVVSNAAALPFVAVGTPGLALT